MHEVLVNRLGGLSLPRKSVVRLTDRPDMTLDVYRGRKTTLHHYLTSSGEAKVQDAYSVHPIYTKGARHVFGSTHIFYISKYTTRTAGR